MQQHTHFSSKIMQNLFLFFNKALDEVMADGLWLYLDTLVRLLHYCIRLFLPGYIYIYDIQGLVLWKPVAYKKVYSINWPKFIVWLPLLLEILSNMCIAIVYFPDYDAMMKLTLSF